MNKNPIILALTAATLLVAGKSAHATAITWADSAGNTNWTSTNSWVGGIAPSNSAAADQAIFASVINAQPYMNATNRGVNGIDCQLAAGGLNFTSMANGRLNVGTGGIDATTQSSGTNTMVTDVFQFANSTSVTAYSLFSTNSGTATDSTFNLASPSILLNNSTGNIDIQLRRYASAGGNGSGIVNISGAISGTNTGTVGLQFSGTAAATNGALSKDYNFVNLTGNSSFNSRVTINGVTLTANSLADSNNPSALGANGDIYLGGGLSGGTSANRQNAALVFSGLSSNSVTDRRIIFAGGTSAQTHALKNNDATYTVAFNNTGDAMDTNQVNGTRTIQFGGINTGNNIFAENIGNPTLGGTGAVTKIDAGKWVLTGNNTYSGATTISNGTLQVGDGGTSGSLGTNNVNITNSGTLAFNRSDNIVLANRIYGTGDLVKLGEGTLTLAANNPKTGTIAINAGVLEVTNGAAILNTATVTLADAAGAGLLVSQFEQIGSLRGGGTSGGNVSISASASLAVVETNSQTFAGSITNAGNFTKAGAGTLILSGNNAYGTTTILDGTLQVGNGGASGSLGTSDVADNASLVFSRSDNLTVSNAISGTGTVTKSGSGTLTLSGTNTYSGGTTIEAGTLRLAPQGSMQFVIAGAGTNNAIGGAGTLAADGTFVIDLASAATNSGSSWQLVSATNKAFGTGFNVAGFTYSAGVWSLATNSVTYQFKETTGTLSVAAASAYDTWASGYGLDPATTGAPGADPDADSFANASEYAFGTSPVVGNAALTTAAASGGNLVVSFIGKISGVTYTVQQTADLVAGPWTSAGVTITPGSGPTPPSGYEWRQFSAPRSGAKLFYRVIGSY